MLRNDIEHTWFVFFFELAKWVKRSRSDISWKKKMNITLFLTLKVSFFLLPEAFWCVFISRFCSRPNLSWPCLCYFFSRKKSNAKQAKRSRRDVSPKKPLRAVEQLATASPWILLPLPLKMPNLPQGHFVATLGRARSNSCIFLTREGKKNPAVQSPEHLTRYRIWFGLISAEPKYAGL
jgi:hypothetical protein